jgi:hypothetical protein
MDTKTENKTIAAQLFAGMADRPTLKSRPSIAIVDCPTLEAEPSSLHQNTSDDAPMPMEEDKTEEDDLLGEDLVHY